jgi:ElaB/YqjD/DUF883 family membrane-anchored ribosome-binding protein
MGQGPEDQLTREIAGTRQDLSRDLDALTDKVSPSQIMERRKEATRSRLRSMRERVMGSAESSRQGVTAAGGSLSSGVSDTASSAVGTIERRAEGNPLAAGAIAFGAGWLLSSLLPASEKETQAAQQLMERGQPLVDEARSVGQEMGGTLKESATQAAQEVRSSAQDSAQTVKMEGRSAAEAVKDDGRSSAESVAGDVRGRTS